MHFKVFCICLTVLLGIACSGGDNGGNNPGTPSPPQSTYDKGALLTSWADDFIIPSLDVYVQSLDQLDIAIRAFAENPSQEHLDNARQAWKVSAIRWQHVSMYDIGAAETIGLRNYSNIYPVDTQQIESNIISKDYNLELPSNFDVQGLQALDYMLYGYDDILKVYSDNPSYGAYTTDLVQRLQQLAQEVLNDWNNGYRDAFVTDVSSTATSSTNKLVNDIVFYYERFLRSGKVGIPAGAFSGTIQPQTIEGRYSVEYSKEFLNEANQNFTNFFNGTRSDGSTAEHSLAAYLDYLNELSSTNKVATSINDQFGTNQTLIDNLGVDFAQILNDDLDSMLLLFDSMQETVALLKVEMLQVLNIRVDYIDADGD